MAAWVRFSALLFALKFSTFSVSVTAISAFSPEWRPSAVAYFVLIGLLLAFTVFITSAVAIP